MVKDIGCVQKAEQDKDKSIFATNCRLARYVVSTRNYCGDLGGGVLHLSLRTDKSNVGSLPLQNPFMQCNGGGIVFPALAQVTCVLG